jgi:NADH dehydrogenase
MAGALSELIRLVLVKDYPALNLDDTRVLLIEAAARLLGAMPARLSAAALRSLERKHVEVRLGAGVVDFDGTQVRLREGQGIPAHTIIWAAGVQAASLQTGLDGLATARQRRIVVSPTLQTPSHPEVFVIGDAAYLEHDGEALPMMAPVAMQQAETAAQNIRRLIAGQAPVAFRYSDPGSLATIGRNAAVAYVKGVQFTGFVAWVVWLVVHLIQIIGFRNKLFVLLSWAWDYFLYERAVRLISTR